MLTVLAVPAFEDNYIWVIHDGASAAVVDPGDAGPVVATLGRLHLSLAAILLTHHHADHVGGVPELLQLASVPVFGPRDEAISTITRKVTEGDTVTIPELALTLSVINVPGHTKGHIAYVAHQHHWLFCGDTLFAGGCGRLFEGTPEQMAASLAKLAMLPEHTEVYCAHEYTLSNLRFAQAAEPDNAAVSQRMQSEQAKRAQGLPTVPSTIGLEKKTNPFLRYREAGIMDRLIAEKKIATREPIESFAALRQWKNSFR